VDKMAGTIARRSTKAKSPFLVERPNRTIPRTSPSVYTRDLFKRSDEAVEKLKRNRFGKYSD
jgi:hypothetical protein